MKLDLFTESKNPLVENSMFKKDELYPESLKDFLGLKHSESAKEEIKTWPNYEKTPLHRLSKIEKTLSLGPIYYKDESTRFGLGSFKSLGGAYALLCILQEELSKQKGFQVSTSSIRDGQYREDCEKMTVVTATDGNHGRSVAWGAKLFNCQCKIYMHEEVSKGRQKIVEELGAEVVRVKGNYDDSVIVSKIDASKNDWFVVSDTSTEDYKRVPGLVMSGYSILIEEALKQMGEDKPTHVFLQAGVGGLAAAVCSYFWQRSKRDLPRFIIVEPELADCLYQSAYHKKPTLVDIQEESVMAGLSCGKISYVAWEILSRKASHFMKIPESYVPFCMKSLHSKEFSEESIEAGESAVAGLAALIEASLDKDRRHQLGLNEKSIVLLLGTEGATDPDIYKKIINTH